MLKKKGDDKNNDSIIIDPPMLKDLDHRQPLIENQNITSASQIKTQDTSSDIVARSLDESHLNPYADRGFTRGLNENPLISKFLCCYDLETGMLFSAFYDCVVGMIFFVLIFASKKFILPFHMIYCATSIGRLVFYYRLNKEDNEKSRC